MAINVAIKIGLAIASAAMTAMQTSAAGKAQQKVLNHQAAQARQAAGQERASSQRAAAEQKRRGRLVSSRALALSAASGGGTGGNVETILGDIGAEGEFRALNELFIGEERARNLETQSDVKVFEGKEAVRAAKSKATLGVLNSGISMYAKYGSGIT